MNIQETLALIESLKLNGVIRFKSGEHEIEFGPKDGPFSMREPKLNNESAQASAEVVADATEKLKNLINTVKMSPEELANKMFPDGAE